MCRPRIWRIVNFIEVCNRCMAAEETKGFGRDLWILPVWRDQAEVTRQQKTDGDESARSSSEEFVGCSRAEQCKCKDC